MPVEEKKLQAKFFNPKLFGDDEFDKVHEWRIEESEPSASYLVALWAVNEFSWG